MARFKARSLSASPSVERGRISMTNLKCILTIALPFVAALIGLSSPAEGLYLIGSPQAYPPIAEPQSPVQINSCYEWQNFMDEDRDVYFAASFVNDSPKTVTAIKFDLVIINPFNEIVTTLTATQTGDLSPGATFQPPTQQMPNPDTLQEVTQFQPIGMWAIQDDWGHGNHYTCAVDTVAFDDGTVWNFQLAKGKGE
jgi:hypothetical protein